MAKHTSDETTGGETKGAETKGAETKGAETKGAETQMVPNFFINYQMPKVFLAVGRTRWIAIAIFSR